MEPRLPVWKGERMVQYLPALPPKQVWGPPGTLVSAGGSGAGEVWQEGTGGGGKELFTLALPMFSLGPSSCSQK